MNVVSEKDGDELCFLWVDDITKEEPEPIILWFSRVVFRVVSGPVLLNATIQFHLKIYALTQPNPMAKLMKSFHVDNVVTGAVDKDQAYILYKTSKEVFKEHPPTVKER